MFKRILLGLSLLAGGVGFWTMSQVHAKDVACQAYASTHPGAAVGAVCARVVPTYLAGSLLAGVGSVVLVLTLFAIVRRSRAERWHERMPSVPSVAPLVMGSVRPTLRVGVATSSVRREIVKV